MLLLDPPRRQKKLKQKHEECEAKGQEGCGDVVMTQGQGEGQEGGQEIEVV